MSNELSLFELPKSMMSLLDGIQDTLADTLSGGGSTNRRISIKGNAFREVINGKEVRVNRERELNVVVINAAPVSRTFFAKGYVEGEVSRPTCWSADTQKPDAAVPQATRQAAACKDCPQNIKGSGQGDSRACRFQQRLAVLLEGEIAERKVYQMALPSTSIFGSDNNKMGMQAYARYLKAHNIPPIAVVTQIAFDLEAPTPKLLFKAVRPLTPEEVAVVIEMREHEDTMKAITFTVSQMDGVQEAPAFETPKIAAKPEPKAEPKKAVKPKAEPEPEVEEPVKVESKKPEVVEERSDLKGIVDGWDD